MKRVTGIGGIFFKAQDADTLRAWYRTHLGIDVQEWGGAAFTWQSADNPQGVGSTIWSVFSPDSAYLGDNARGFMVNYRVANLRELIAALRAEGCRVDDKIEESEFGVFGWVTDPEGNRIELWQPPAGS